MDFDCAVDFFFDFADCAEVDLAPVESLLAAAARFPGLFLCEAREEPLWLLFACEDNWDRRAFNSDCKARVAAVT